MIYNIVNGGFVPMKKSLLLLFVTGSVLLSGCVSTDRMARMSGGVFSEYSAPPTYRLRSEKFMRKTPHADSIKRSNKTEIAGVNETLINVWPFFFRNASYWSVLWPFIDCDKYGFAIRPIYVQDGDEHSVFFPLSSWNTADKDGWIANFVWRKDGAFGFVPFTWQDTKKDHGWLYYTPFMIHNYDRRPYKFNSQNYIWHYNERSDYFTEIMLAYWAKSTYLDFGDWRWLYLSNSNAAKAYHFAKLGKALPKDEAELNKFKKSVFDTLPQKNGRAFGFFPLFHYASNDDGNINWQFLLLNGYEKTKNRKEWAFFAPLISYKSEELIKVNGFWRTAEDEFFSLPLLSKFTTTKRFADQGAVKTLRKFYNLNRQLSYNQNLPRINELLKELDPNLKLPKTVVDYDTLNLFLEDWAKDKDFPIEYSYSGGCLPLFLYDIKGDFRKYTIPALLSGYERNGDYKEFVSVPLLTFMEKTKNSGYLRIAPPFVYMDSQKQHDNLHTKKIHTIDTKMPKKWDVVEENDIYAALGLFYRGKIAFHVAKGTLDGEDLEFLRSSLLNYYAAAENIKVAWENYQRDVKRVQAWKPKDKIDFYKKCIREEELKIRAEEIRKMEQNLEKLWQNIQKLSAKFQFSVTKKDVASREAAVKAVNRLLKDYTELRWKEDIGNGIFFRKEKFYNGDYNWRFLWFIASGEKVGEKESSNVLHLLYRYRRDGKRSERLFFPFVSIVEDGADSKFSFLWRVFQLKEEKGKTSGYFMFIPF